MVERIGKTYASAEEIPERIDRNGMVLGSRYYRDSLELPFDDVIAYCAAYKGDTLLLHGTADALVPCESSLFCK